MLFDEASGLMQTIAKEFSDIISMESIGKTYDSRDIWMMKLDATKVLTPSTGGEDKAKAILMTGAHHSRELVST